MLHAFCAAVAHGVEERLAFALAFFDVFAGAHRRFQNLHGGDASLAILLGEEALRNNEAKGFRKAGADGMLIRHGENTDDALDGFCRINGVQRGHDKVARFRGFESDFNRLAVAPFAYENEFWRLAQRRAQGQRKSRRIGMQFALMDGRFLMAMQKLDGFIESRNLVWNDAHDDGATAALLENIYAETPYPGDSIRKIGGAVLLELAC